MTDKNKFIRPPEINRELHKEIKKFAIDNDCSIQEAYEKILKLGLEKKKEENNEK